MIVPTEDVHDLESSVNSTSSSSSSGGNYSQYFNRTSHPAGRNFELPTSLLEDKNNLHNSTLPRNSFRKNPKPPAPVSMTPATKTPSLAVHDFDAQDRETDLNSRNRVKNFLGINTTCSSDCQKQDDETALDESAVVECGRPTLDTGDSSILDSFLKKQSERVECHNSTTRELLDTQRWGTFDPRKVWPKKPNASQKERKMMEIKARGSRKSHFGKPLRPHTIRERKEMGWDAHQTCERRHDAESTCMIQKLEELFGAGIGNCVPAIIDKRFVMHEKEREPEPKRPGRQKVATSLLVLPVGK